MTSEGRVLFWECEFEQVGVSSGSEGARQHKTLLTSHPVSGVDLVSLGTEVDEGFEADRGRGISLDQTVAPTWFTPPDGKNLSDTGNSLNSLHNKHFGFRRFVAY